MTVFKCLLIFINYCTNNFVSVPPSIRTTPANGVLTARKGGSITLECKASGNPVPNIIWSRKVSTYLFSIKN